MDNPIIFVLLAQLESNRYANRNYGDLLIMRTNMPRTSDPFVLISFTPDRLLYSIYSSFDRQIQHMIAEAPAVSMFQSVSRYRARSGAVEPLALTHALVYHCCHYKAMVVW